MVIYCLFPDICDQICENTVNKITSASLLLILLIFMRIANAYIASYSNTSTTSIWPELKREIICDYQKYYANKGIPYLIGGLSVGAVMANSHFDTGLNHEWQAHFRNHFTNEVSRTVNHYSEITQYPISFPFFFTLWWLSEDAPKLSAMNTWSHHCLRTLLIGAPQQAALTTLLGSGRPENSPSHWQWCKHDRAVSGHAFYGAVPLLNLAQQTSSVGVKSTCYVLSVLPGLARINDNKHYASQVFLGWWLAFSATQIVWRSEIVSKKPNRWSLELFPQGDAIYLGLHKNI